MTDDGYRTLKIRLYPNKREKKELEAALEGFRILYNGLLEECRRIHADGGAFPGRFGMYELIKVIRAKIPDTNLDLMYSQAQGDVGDRIYRAFCGFFRRCKDGETPGYPRFRGIGRYHSFTYTQNGFSLDDRKLKLGKIGSIAFRGGREMHGKAKTCTVRKERTGKWYATVAYGTDIVGEGSVLLETDPTPAGIDLGVGVLAMLSDGTVYENQRHLEKDLDRIAKVQRKMSASEKGSAAWLRYRQHLAHLFEHVNNRRRSHLNDASRDIADRHDAVAMEGLNVKGMMEHALSHTLARSIGSASWGMFANMISRKVESTGGKVVFVDPRNTSQMCSGCGDIVPKDLSVRRHVCPRCGLDMDRDRNAAINILRSGFADLRPRRESA